MSQIIPASSTHNMSLNLKSHQHTRYRLRSGVGTGSVCVWVLSRLHVPILVRATPRASFVPRKRSFLHHAVFTSAMPSPFNSTREGQLFWRQPGKWRGIYYVERLREVAALLHYAAVKLQKQITFNGEGAQRANCK